MRNPRKEVGKKYNELVDYSQIINTPGGAGAGTVTSVDMTVPTGLTISGNPITTSGTLALTLTSGYLIPTTASKTDWDSAFNDKIVSASVTGTTTKTLTLTQQDAGTITASWSDISGSGTVTSVAMTVPTGLSISGSPITTSGTLALTLTAGYSIPTTSSQTNWDTAYTNRITSLTVTGSSGASTLVSNVLNIPTYTLTGLGGQPLATNLTSLAALTFASTSFVKMTAAGTFALDTTVYTSNTGTVTSVAMTVPIGLSISGTPITTSGTFALTLTAGYSIPTTTSQTNWDTAYTNRITSLTTTGSSGSATLVSNVLNIPTYTLAGLGGISLTSLSSTATGLTYTNTTGVFSLTSGYSIPSTASQTNWDTAYTNRITSLTTTGSSGAATLVSNVLNIPNYTLAGLGGFANPMTTLGDSIYGAASGTPTRLAGNTTAVKQFLSQTGTGTVSAAPSWATIAGSDVTGAALTKTDDTNVTLTLGGTPTTALLRATSITVGWTGTLADARIASAATWNAKFTLPSLTSGSVLFSDGTTIAQDNANLFWDNTNNRLGIGTSSPANALDVVRGTAGTMARGFYESASVSYNADTKFGIYTASATATDGAALYLGQTNLLNSSSQYGGFELQYRYNSSTTENLRINYVSRLSTGAVSTSTSDLLLISKTGAATFLSSVTATSFVKTSNSPGQILMSDGSIITAGTNITISGGTISASGGSGTDFYTTNGTLTSARTISGGGFDLTYSDNKNSTAQFVISNTTAGTTSTAALKLNSDASAGYGFIGKVSSSWTTNATITSNDLAIINYTAGDISILNTFATGLITFGVGTGTTPLMTLTNDGHLLIGTTTNSTYHLDVNGDANANKINLAAGTATRVPLDFTPGSAVLKTTPIAGDAEVSADGKFYYTHNTSERGVIDAFQFFVPNSNISLTAQTAAQKIFNTLTNGAITLKAATNYYFDIMLNITGMAASGSFGFANGGAATFSNILWWSTGIKGAVTNAQTFQSTYNTSFTNATLVTAGASTVGFVHIRGKFRVLASGTFIPQISFGTIPTTPVIVAGSYFKITAISDNLTDSIGNWS